MNTITAGVRVLVVLDPDFGSQLDDWANLGPVWLCESPANRAAAQKLWATKELPADHVTVFDMSNTSSREEELRRVVGDVDLHHPDWAWLHLVGVARSPRVKSALAAFGNGELEETATSLVFKRRS